MVEAFKVEGIEGDQRKNLNVITNYFKTEYY